MSELRKPNGIWKIRKIGPSSKDSHESLNFCLSNLAKNVDGQLSPKALRAAKLKTRFADTTPKGKRTLSYHEYKDDPVGLQKEKQRLQRKQREEMARIKSQINTEQRDLRLQREREREAARIALEEMKKTVEFNDFCTVLKDFEQLIGCSLPDQRVVWPGFRRR
ncbi:unnamed protein product [Ilex paraguariensis]|uniref:Uncharacterized protein n=1 Tax=Ilex paraguariensis TaxID=185542 RepID=A0ABC8QVI3_9AQUA